MIFSYSSVFFTDNGTLNICGCFTTLAAMQRSLHRKRNFFFPNIAKCLGSLTNILGLLAYKLNLISLIRTDFQWWWIDVTTQKINLHISAGTGLETAEAGFKKVAVVFPESLIIYIIEMDGKTDTAIELCLQYSCAKWCMTSWYNTKVVSFLRQILKQRVCKLSDKFLVK